MSKMRFLLIGFLVFALFIAAPSTFAQRDRDGDGLPDNVDSCPNEPGPRSNKGCPLSDSTNGSTGGGTPDRDGDGVPDYVDLCPGEVGTGFTEGCPVDAAPNGSDSAQPANPPRPVFAWESNLVCEVGLFPNSTVSVNVRAEASTRAAVIGHLAPGQQFAPLFRDYDAGGQLWYGGAPAGDSWGWVAASVVVDNGMCANLPLIVHTVMPFLPDIDLSLDPNLLPDEPAYVKYKLTHVKITSYSVSGSADDAASQNPSGGVEHTDDWDVHGLYVLLLLLDELGNPLPGDPPFEPMMIIEMPDTLISHDQSGDSPKSSPGETFDYYNVFTAIPEPVHSGGFQPLLFIKPHDPNAPAASCVDIGADHCMEMLLLLPALGDAPGQCPPQQLINGLHAAFPGAQASSSDLALWQSHLGNSGAQADKHGGWIDVLTPLSGNTSAIHLLLPAIQDAHEAGARQREVELKNASAYRSSSGDEADDSPKGGSVEFEWEIEEGEALLSEQMSLNYEQIEWKWLHSCAILSGVPGTDGSLNWSALLLPAVQ